MKRCRNGHVNPETYTSGECKLCRRAKAKQDYAANPEPAKARSRAWHKANSDRAKARALTWRNANKEVLKAKGRANYLRNREKHRDYGWRQRGIDPEQARALLAAHNGKCDACGTSAPGGRDKSWHVDHEHTTGKLRGVLCHFCNTGIGLLGDNIEGVMRAAAYLRRHRK